MSYSSVVNLIFAILGGLYGAMFVHFIIFAIVGIFRRKKFPAAEKKNRYGIIIPARNEEKVIGHLIDSIRKSDYPDELLKIFVVAHNCTDRTADIARAAGVQVYEYDNDGEKTMGYAIRYLFAQIENDFGTASFDGFFVFNADNIVAGDFFTKMNDAFEYYGGRHVITSVRNSKNFGANYMSALYGMYFAYGCLSESRGRTVTGCSTRVPGCGYVFGSDVVKNGWPYVTLTEDWEFSADQVLVGRKISYCDDAVFYDEQPTTMKIMWRQRLRWARGHLLICVTRMKDLIRGLFDPKQENHGSVFDMTANSQPFCLVLFTLMVLQQAFLLLSPLFGESLSDVFFGWDETKAWWYNLFLSLNAGSLIVLLKNACIGYLTFFLSSILAYILARKKIRNVSPFRKIQSVILFPIFMIAQALIDVQAFFSKNLGWKTIPHNDAKGSDQMK